jgi:hypothetical protein
MTKKFSGSCKVRTPPRGPGPAPHALRKSWRAPSCTLPHLAHPEPRRPSPCPLPPAPPPCCQVWLHAIEHALSSGGDAAGDAARKLLERGLAALPRRKHVKAISHAALLEFRGGSAERGRSMMEGVLRNYPKRLDLWSMYIDQVGGGGRGCQGRGRDDRRARRR